MITRKMLKSGVNFLVKLTKRERERKRENKKLIEFSDAVASPALWGAASKWKKHQNWSSIHAESEWGIVDRELCRTAGLQDCRTAGAPVHFTGVSGRYWQPMLWPAGPRRLPHWQPLRLTVVSHWAMWHSTGPRGEMSEDYFCLWPHFKERRENYEFVKKIKYQIDRFKLVMSDLDLQYVM